MKRGDAVGDASRRHLLKAAAGLGFSVALRPAAAATPMSPELQASIRDFTGGAMPAVGRVRIEIASLIENGNAVPITVGVDSPTTAADHVQRIALFNERNPQRDVAIFILGPRAGRATVSTRIRLATSQRLVAVAQSSDGSFWRGDADVVVTLAACIEG